MTNMMLKSKIAKVVMAGTCFTLISAGSAFAAEPATLEAAISGNSSSSAAYMGQVAGDYELAPRHQEIDRLLFEDGGLEKFQAAGFTVTHTGPMNDVIEIGITPYEDSFADMVIELVGEDQVKVVEGVQAVPLIAGPDTPVASTDVAEPAFSTLVVGAPEPGEGEVGITAIPEDGLDTPVSDGPDTLESVATDGDAIVEDARVISATGDGAEAIADDVQLISAPAETGAPSASNVWPWVAAIAAGLAAAGLIIRKVLVSKK